MSPFNPISTILGQNKLEGSNYVDWRRNLEIVLTAEEYKFVLHEECPLKPNEQSSDEDKLAYQKWRKADEMAQCYIMASMSNVLQHQHQAMLSAFEILENLKQMFGDQGRSAKQTAMRTLMNTKMVEGTPVRDHVLKMIGLLNELEVLGAGIDNDSQVEMILQSLPDSFQQFCLNYNMNKMSLSLAQLLNELQAAETLVKKAPSMELNAEKVSTSKPQGGQKKKKAHKAKTFAPPTGGVKKSKGKCFHCKMPGHWKTHCPDFLAKKKNNLDLGATDHICTTLQGFQEMRKLIRGEW
ncbi:hypothetical protein KY284_026051 [Solanum tuberosum]|nr:hypothetical protein KY284_026051 [Solanum tuberosum]